MTAIKVRDRAQAQAVVGALQALGSAIEAMHRVDDVLIADPMIESLEGLLHAFASNDIAALSARGGPVRWSRERIGRCRSTVDAARTFVGVVSECLASADVAALSRSETAAAFADQLSVWLATVGARYGLVGDPQRGARASMVREIQRVAKRKRSDANGMAIGLLVGWGVPRARAHDLLKYAQ